MTTTVQEPAKMTTQAMVLVLAEILTKAKEAALAADIDHSDRGTCNCDTPAFRIEGARDSAIQRAAKLAGVECQPFKWFGGQRWYWARVPLHGQGGRREVMMEAAQKVLHDNAHRIPAMKACGYHQMD
jgi:hypothetical protein